jgi:hypothetical protein
LVVWFEDEQSSRAVLLGPPRCSLGMQHLGL